MYTDEAIRKELDETLADGTYNYRTTFETDFAIANAFGIEAVKDTFKRAFAEWKDDIVYLTELAMVTNMYCWHYCATHEELSRLYADCYYKCYDYAWSSDSPFSDAELSYYHRCTD